MFQPYFYGRKAGKLFAAFLILIVIIQYNVPLAFADSEVSASTTPAATSAVAGTSGSSAEGGTAGDSGTTASSTPVSGPAVVQTGNATSSVNAGNQVNVNDTQSVASSTDGSPAVGTTTVSAVNNASASTTATSSATTGDNAIENSGDATVGSGNAFAEANVINVVNANIVNSEGLILLLNRLAGGTLNIADLFNGSQNSPCSLTACDQNGVVFNAHATNTADIGNTLDVLASSGGNSATSTRGNAYVTSGDAYAAANVLNVANLNVVDSNYLLVSINNFGDLTGDVVLPNAEFFNGLFAGTAPGSTSAIANTNNADVINDATVLASSSGNTASTTNGGFINTGASGTGVGITNQLNTNLAGGKTVYILFRVYGDWGGKIFGLPPGLSWTETPNGVEIFNASGSANPLAPLTSTAANDARIKNKINVTALTGDNHISAVSGGVTSGKAYAAANILNVANANVLGQNWIFAVFNIFGNWNGNISFGQPNLWIGGEATMDSYSIQPGSSIRYKFTVKNRGNSPATHVKLKLNFASDFMRIEDAPADGAQWDIGTLAPGASMVIERVGHVRPDSPNGVALPMSATVTSYESDADLRDNTEQLPLNVAPITANAHVSYTPSSDLQIDTKIANPEISAPGAADIAITVHNRGGPAYHAELINRIVDEKGKVVSQKAWPLETVHSGEDVVVKYKAAFAGASPLGVYKSIAQVRAVSGNPNVVYGNWGDSPVSSASFTVVQNARTQYLAKNTKLVCAPYLLEFMGPTLENPSNEVTKLQTFLRDHAYGTQVTGVWDEQTQKGVIAYQSDNREKILDPWGVPQPTGYVYYTTKKLINDTQCLSQSPNALIEPLSPEAQKEIQDYKAQFPNIETINGLVGSVLPSNKASNLAKATKAAAQKKLARIVPAVTKQKTSLQAAPKAPNAGAGQEYAFGAQTASAAAANPTAYGATTTFLLSVVHTVAGAFTR